MKGNTLKLHNYILLLNKEKITNEIHQSIDHRKSHIMIKILRNMKERIIQLSKNTYQLVLSKNQLPTANATQ